MKSETTTIFFKFSKERKKKISYFLFIIGTPFAAHAALATHYMKNGCQNPTKNSKEMVLSIVSTIKAFGGEVLTKASVKKILVD